MARPGPLADRQNRAMWEEAGKQDACIQEEGTFWRLGNRASEASK